MALLITKNYNAFKNKRDVQLFMKKLYRFLHSNHTIKFKYLESDCAGKMWPYINPTRVLLDKRAYKHTHYSPVSTLIHEVLHFVYQDACETWVRRMEPRIFKQLNKQQIDYIETLLQPYM